ncbi:hypothetical protein ES288_D09G005600v1 [Gossypium darwinii]|uniref:Beta-1,4-mannosyltransferase n=1 Tax=Gossypium darwinii TaxID=34276 RepID=A0A5D2B454_GOSDA|nr:hypothetical protein ES288_D09G005600v1 [Gossypium darwinii]
MKKIGRACVVILGDLGHSPRMQYHALSLARSEPHSAVIENESIHIHTMPIIQFVILLWFLCFKVLPPDAFIVQNPPSIPTLMAVKWVSSLRKSAFIVDWHNFGYTLLGLSVGRSSPFVSIYCWFEKRYGQIANGSLCVTREMQLELAQNWGNRYLCHPLGVQDCIDTDILLKTYRPALVVSSTSWTPDEDFEILLEAAEISGGKQYLYPRLLFIITGKGPEKEKYEEKIKRLNLKRVAFRTMWLSTEEYPLLLGSADLGVYWHTSSSGLDLPMKVVDMFGCGLPVCALVKVEKNGLLFSSSSELVDELLMLFRGFPNECDALKSLKNGALETGSSARWAAEWEEHAKPLISEVI